MKSVATALAFVCIVLTVFVLDERSAVAAWRVTEGAASPLIQRAGGWIGHAPARLRRLANSVATPASDPADAPSEGRFHLGADGILGPGDIRFDAAEIAFADGTVLTTVPERIAAAGEVWNLEGDTFARTLDADPDAQIEIRRVASSSRTAGSPTAEPGPCGAPAGHVALLLRGGRLDLMLFGQGPPPGSGARRDALCGDWRYDRA